MSDLADTTRPFTEDEAPTVYSVGHSNHSLERLIELLGMHGIEAVADVRSSPWSRYVPWFGRTVLEKELPRHGVRYVFMGDQLGGKPSAAEYQGIEDRAELYRHIEASADFKDGIERLLRGARTYRVAMLCSEEDPNVCHRQRLVTPVLQRHGASVKHVRGTGAIEVAASLAGPATQPVAPPTQLSLAL